VRENEHVEITLTMLVAHLTFILSELIGSHLAVFGHRIRLSSIIATVVASMVIGNYGRPKISPGVERYMERFWGYFAFIANSLVFILMGLLFADLPIHFGQFVVPIIVTVAVVIVGRGLSIYPVVWLVNRTRREEHIPASWQHLLAWGSLRGALAMTMVLLIPDDLRVPGWDYGFTVKEFVAALTIGCIYFTLVVKATTIGALIRRMRLSELTPLESIEYHESRALIYARALERLEELREQGSMKAEVWERLGVRRPLSARVRDCHACFGTVRGTRAARSRRMPWAWSGACCTSCSSPARSTRPTTRRSSTRSRSSWRGWSAGGSRSPRRASASPRTGSSGWWTGCASASGPPRRRSSSGEASVTTAPRRSSWAR
jgi:NhaP-type Na+/H+ or K+/H+ antiporter